MSSASLSPSKRVSKTRISSFTKVYQACENCRQKKQRCNLGDPAGPHPPCQACRRANIVCILPQKKRQGRPPKKPRQESLADVTHQPAWQTSMASFEPVVGTGDDASVETSRPASSHSQKQLSSYDQQLASQALATFPLRNTSDAIKLLDQAEANSNGDIQHPSATPQTPTVGTVDLNGVPYNSPGFILVQEGYIDEMTLLRLFRLYVVSIHPIMPLIPYKRMPITSEDVLAMAIREPHFMAAILVITASLTADETLNARLWQRVQVLFSEVAIVGVGASVDVIEGLLLLSEYPPNMGHGSKLGFEDRMCWMTVGAAVRLGYLLGLEQLGMVREDVDESLVGNRDRGKVAWSYCYCLDRQISLRLGKSFWHRSPGMTYHHLHVDPSEDFPEMCDIPGVQDDNAAYLQCLVHITQILSNAHDILYPSKSRSLDLAKAEHYYKYIDDFTETLSAFRNRWQKKPWRTYPMNECVWISFHHLRLYIYSFSLQGHMQRVSNSSDGKRITDFFPTGLMGASDSRFIIEAINAAADVLRLAIGRLQPSGALSYLPLRFFHYFSHAAVFLLKAAVVVPLPPSQKRAIFRLIRALVRCLSMALANPQHPGLRYSSALESLLRRICRDRDIQTPGVGRPSQPPSNSNSNAVWSNSSTIHSSVKENELPAFLGTRESSFIPEQPFQDLAADIDALFGLAPDNPHVDLQPAAESIDPFLYDTDPLASLFSNQDQEFWEPFTWTNLE